MANYKLSNCYVSITAPDKGKMRKEDTRWRFVYDHRRRHRKPQMGLVCGHTTTGDGVLIGGR